MVDWNGTPLACDKPLDMPNSCTSVKNIVARCPHCNQVKSHISQSLHDGASRATQNHAAPIKVASFEFYCVPRIMDSAFPERTVNKPSAVEEHVIGGTKHFVLHIPHLYIPSMSVGVPPTPKHGPRRSRPLQESRAARSANGKSYTKRSAKPKPRAGSPTSSRKRSSVA